MALRIRPLLISGAVLLLSLGITLLLWSHERKNVERNLKANLDFTLREATSSIEQRMATYEQIALGVKGFFYGSERPSRSAFQAYLNSLESGAEYSGIQAMGLASIVLPSELKSHVASMRMSGLAAYEVYPQGARKRYAPIVQMEPSTATNSQVFGYDPLSDPELSKAMLRAADSGSLSISRGPKIRNRSAKLGSADYAMFLPLYRPGNAAETPAQRSKAIVGWVFSFLRISDLMASVYGERRNDIEISLHDNIERQSESLVYESGKTAAKPAGMEAIEYLSIGGATWVLTVHAGANFSEAAGNDKSGVILIGGTLFSGLLALVCWQMLAAKNSAVALAMKMTSELRKSEELARHLAQHDTLTDLPNRALFSDRIGQALSLARRDKTRLAVLYIDLDSFKPINDLYGHAVGDAVLRAVASRLSEAIRESDTVGRIGGDEFVVLLPGIASNENVQMVGTKILESLACPFEVAGQTISLSASIGIATFPEHGEDEVSLFKAADQAMYQAKANHRNCLLWAT